MVSLQSIFDYSIMSALEGRRGFLICHKRLYFSFIALWILDKINFNYFLAHDRSIWALLFGPIDLWLRPDHRDVAFVQQLSSLFAMLEFRLNTTNPNVGTLVGHQQILLLNLKRTEKFIKWLTFSKVVVITPQTLCKWSHFKREKPILKILQFLWVGSMF